MHCLNLELAECKQWLAQFDKADQSLASTLLNRLTIITAQEFEQWLQQVRASLSPSDVPFAAYAIRPLDANEQIFSSRVSPITRVAPRIGSEGRIAHVIKRWHDMHDEIRVFDHPNLQTMANGRVKTILLLDDQLGSGKRSKEYLAQFIASPTIKSWISGGFVKIRVLTMVSLPRGRDILANYISKLPRSQRLNISFSSDFVAPSLISQSSEEEKELIRQLLKNYEHKLPQAERQWTYGHKKSFGTVVFQHGCPNNLPGMFWSNRSLGWKGLFPDRTVPEVFLEASESKPVYANLLPKAPTKAHEVLLQLYINKRSIPKLSQYLKIRQTTVKRCLDYLRLLGAIDEQMRLTPKGLSIVKSLEDSHFPKYIASLSPNDIYLPSR